MNRPSAVATTKYRTANRNQVLPPTDADTLTPAAVAVAMTPPLVERRMCNGRPKAPVVSRGIPIRISDTPTVFARACVDLDLIAGGHEQRHLHLEPRVELRGLEHLAGGVA